tara:strand:- start:64581 stop:65093 length:513 start_codon:yes stop_codon:yes gene_type:complete
MKLRPLLIAALVLALTGCKPSAVFGPGSHKEELLGGDASVPDAGTPAPQPLYFPSGSWEDGLGNTWDISVSGDSLTGPLTSGPITGLVMVGAIQDSMLSYEIAPPANPPIATGGARLLDDAHALFETRNMDGSLNAHGLLHFNHPAFVAAGQPIDLRPQADAPDTRTEGN